jgi:hypothetical protein
VEEAPDAFDIFARWLYGGELALIEPDLETGLALCLKVYVLADKFFDTELMGLIIEMVKEWATMSLIRGHEVAYVYENLPEGSRMRKEVAKSIAYDVERFCSQPSFYKVEWNDILAEVRRNRDFAVDLLVATAEMIGKDK